MSQQKLVQGHTARKRFGQNFLCDTQIIQKIIDAVLATSPKAVVEIGPGLGALTAPLLKHLPHLHVVEIDRDLIARLEQTYPPEKLSIWAGDALKQDFNAIAPEEPLLTIVGNLPYNISTPLLFHLSNFAPRVASMTFMLQKEVVERMIANPGEADYGRLSVMLQYRYRMGKLFDVPPEAFRPAPKVTSAIVRMVPRPPEQLAARDTTRFEAIVTAAFGKRRKTLRNTLQEYLTDTDFAALNIDPTLRGEVLSVDDFIRLANYIKPA